MKENRYGLVCLVLAACLLMTGAMSFAGPTLTCGGRVYDADDEPSADGGTWTVYSVDDSSVVAQETVGEFSSGYWAGEVGAFLKGLAINDELICIVEKETAVGTVEHKGYYAVMNQTLTNGDPAQFDECNLREIPVPSVAIVGNDVQLNWGGAAEDSGTLNIVGYNVYRSSDGIQFTKINSETITETNYSDQDFALDTYYYAIGLVYRGSLPKQGAIISANSELIQVIDTDADGLLDIFELSTCTDPNDADTDDDGIPDGVEDQNHNGTIDSGETDPCDEDTDDDGIQDGTESGITESIADPDGDGPLLGTNTYIFIPDADPTTTTDPLNPDTDGDSLLDGEEDTNHNGRLDPGELDPNHITGDVDGYNDLDLADAILALQVMTGVELSSTVHKEADVNGDARIGIEEVIYILQKVSGLRPTIINVSSYFPVAGTK